MSEHSPIEWTDATWNPVRGCTKVSPGCAHCYAETFAERWRGVPGHPYEQGFDLRLVPETLEDPLRWQTPRRVFVNSMSDLFQDGVPDEYIDRAFAVMALARRHTFQVLTKRAARMRSYVSALTWERLIDCTNKSAVGGLHRPGSYNLASIDARSTRHRVIDGEKSAYWALSKPPLPNVWLGVSVENQHVADERIPLLLQTPAAVRFISAEPLLGPIDFRNVAPCDDWVVNALDTPDPGCRLHWVIVGGESGSGARLCDLAWARAIVAQCHAAHVPVFVKQLGAAPRFDRDERLIVIRSRKGGDMAEWPADLRVREFPHERASRLP